MYGNESRAANELDRADRIVRNADRPPSPGSEIQVVSIGSKLEALRDTQSKALATLMEAQDTLVGPSPETEGKRPQSTYLSDMCSENNELAEAILYASRRLLKLLGERKG
jgi:hypothetical protein